MGEGSRRIFFDKATGEKIQTIIRSIGFIVPSIEQDIATYKSLSERNRETFDVIELPYEAYVQDFATCNGYRVNIETKELEFSYPEPNAPESESVYQQPLSEQIAEQSDYMVDLDFRLSMIELGLM